MRRGEYSSPSIQSPPPHKSCDTVKGGGGGRGGKKKGEDWGDNPFLSLHSSILNLGTTTRKKGRGKEGKKKRGGGGGRGEITTPYQINHITQQVIDFASAGKEEGRGEREKGRGKKGEKKRKMSATTCLSAALPMFPAS